jgi:hypothetical protein
VQNRRYSSVTHILTNFLGFQTIFCLTVFFIEASRRWISPLLLPNPLVDQLTRFLGGGGGAGWIPFPVAHDKIRLRSGGKIKKKVPHYSSAGP